MKKWAKFLCCFAILGAFLVGGLAGCGTVSNIKNKNSELIYNGKAAAIVKADNGNFIYFANAYSSNAPTDEETYSSAKAYSYLARVDGKNLQAKNAYFSPKNVETVSEEVTGYADSFMFVLGQNIYYATPNRQMVTIVVDGQEETDYHFEYTCFYKSSLDGNKKKLYTTIGDISKIEVLKYEKTYYIVMLAGDRLVAINLSNEKAQTLATGVTSVALPKTYQENVLGSSLDWNGQIYFTVNRDNASGSGASTNLVKSILVTSTNPDDAKLAYSQGNVTFIARERDVVFYTDKVGNQQTAFYVSDLTNTGNLNAFLPSSARRELLLEGQAISSASGSPVSDLHIVTRYESVQGDGSVQGYVFKTSSDSKYYIYTPANRMVREFSFSETGASILFVSGRTAYLATSTGLFRADIAKVITNENSQATCQKIADMTGISNTAPIAFDGEYLYFYATLQSIPEDLQDEDENTEDDEEETEETDENLYLHRARVNSTNKFELIGKTVIESRRTK